MAVSLTGSIPAPSFPFWSICNTSRGCAIYRISAAIHCESELPLICSTRVCLSKKLCCAVAGAQKRLRYVISLLGSALTWRFMKNTTSPFDTNIGTQFPKACERPSKGVRTLRCKLRKPPTGFTRHYPRTRSPLPFPSTVMMMY